MYLRVNFLDNDFATCVSSACTRMLYELSDGFKGEDGIARVKEKIDMYGLEAFRKAIVASSYGYYLANRGAQSYYDKQENPYHLSRHEHILDYLDENISIETIDSFINEWENSEVCYLDFENKEVHLQ